MPLPHSNPPPPSRRRGLLHSGQASFARPRTNCSQDSVITSLFLALTSLTTLKIASVPSLWGLSSILPNAIPVCPPQGDRPYKSQRTEPSSSTGMHSGTPWTLPKKIPPLSGPQYRNPSRNCLYALVTGISKKISLDIKSASVNLPGGVAQLTVKMDKNTTKTSSLQFAIFVSFPMKRPFNQNGHAFLPKDYPVHFLATRYVIIA